MRIPRPLALLPVLLVAACAADPPATPAVALPEGAVALGEPLETAERVMLAAVRASPEAFLERTILVEATAENVCQSKGCWMTIKDGDAEPIWVRWSSGCGGKYAFPKDAGGRRVLVQGSFYAKEIAPADAAHLAEESGGLAAEDIVGKTWEMNATACVLLPAATGEAAAGAATSS